MIDLRELLLMQGVLNQPIISGSIIVKILPMYSIGARHLDSSRFSNRARVKTDNQGKI